MKVVARNNILEISGFKKSFSYKGLLIIVNCLVGSWDGKLLLSENNEKRSVKTLPQVASRVTKHSEKSKNSYENK
jgi:hypothetical protein